MTACEECGDDVETGFSFELEFPADRRDPAGRVSGTLCASCADGIATNFLVERGLERGIPADEYEPLLAEQSMMTDGGRDVEEEPTPDCARWVDEDHAVLKIGVTRSMLEYLELEADEHGHDSLEPFITHVLNQWLEEEFAEHHAGSLPVEVELPEDVAQRAALKDADAQARGVEFDPDEFVFNYTTLETMFTLDGKPWALTEGR